MPSKINLLCKECGKEFKKLKKEYNRQIKNGREENEFFCSRGCSTSYSNKQRYQKRDTKGKKEACKIKWSNNFAYFVGLIVSDGNIAKNRPRISFTNKDKELINYVKQIVEAIINKEYEPIKCEKDGCVYWIYQFTSRKLYYFMKNIGIKPNKSKTIEKVNIPDKYFNDFLRGIIDGDGSFYKRGGNYTVTIVSGSKRFLKWLRNKISNKLNLKGYIRFNRNVYSLRYFKDSQEIANYIYNGGMCLTRKRNIIK